MNNILNIQIQIISYQINEEIKQIVLITNPTKVFLLLNFVSRQTEGNVRHITQFLKNLFKGA